MRKAKNKNKNKSQPQRPVVQNASVESKGVTSSPVNSEPVTKDDLASSANQAEFEKKKEALLQQALQEIDEWEKAKAVSEAAAKEAKEALEKLKAKKRELEEQRDELQKQFDEIQDKYNNAEKTVNEATEKADSVKSTADAYAADVRKKADEERMTVLKEAADDAKKVWQTQIDDLTKQIKDIRNRENALNDEKIKLEKAANDIKFEKEVIAEMKEDIENRKKRYDAANPARITALEIELNDEKSKYQALQKSHQSLTEKVGELQALMDAIKTEIEDSENGIHIASLKEIVSSLQELREKYESLAAIYSRYPDDASIAVLEEKAQKVENLERANDALEQERNRYREEAVAARNASKELEIVKQEVEATNALNEHLLQELESHKTALESRTGDTCPSLSKVDTETEEPDFIADIMERTQRNVIQSLSDLVEHIKNYAGNKQLYYTDNDIRAFLAGMSVSRLLILQGMSGTGKSSLPRIFSEAISGFNRLIPVESSWRDRNELLGYYNDFNKKFNAKSFTIELYRSSKDRCQEIPTFIVLDEMNLARIEYYFSDFLAILQEPDHDKWLIELVSSDMRTLPMELPESVKEKMKKESPSVFSIWEKIEKSRQGDLKAETSDEDKEKLTLYLAKLGQLTGAKSLIEGRKIKVTDNIWFVGTANRDESTFEISDKVYDRAQVVSLNRKGIPEKYISTNAKYISVSKLEELFKDAVSTNEYRDEVESRLNALDEVLMEQFDISFGNRIVTQTMNFVAVFVAAGGELVDALDYQISTKILRKVITSDAEEALLELENVTTDYKETQRLIKKRLKELS